MALPKDIRTITDLRQRKAQLRREIGLTKEGVNDQINSIANPSTIRKIIITAALTAAATFALRFFVLRRRREDDDEPVQAAAVGTHNLFVQFMPLLQTILGFVLGYIKEQLDAKRQEQREELQDQRMA